MVRLLCIEILVLYMLAPPVTAVTIDVFSTTQVIPDRLSSCVTGPDMIGGERDTFAYFYSKDVKADINTTVPGQLYHETIKGLYSHFSLVYDGLDGAYSSHNYDGLGHQDLTYGGTSNSFVFDFTQTPSSANINIWVTVRQGSDKVGYSSTSYNGSPQTVFLPFDDFTTQPFPTSLPQLDNITLIDFTDVGYIQIEMSIWDGDDMFALDSITTEWVVPEPATILLLSLGGLFLRRKH